MIFSANVNGGDICCTGWNNYTNNQLNCGTDIYKSEIWCPLKPSSASQVSFERLVVYVIFEGLESLDWDYRIEGPPQKWVGNIGVL